MMVKSKAAIEIKSDQIKRAKRRCGPKFNAIYELLDIGDLPVNQTVAWTKSRVSINYFHYYLFVDGSRHPDFRRIVPLFDAVPNVLFFLAFYCLCLLLLPRLDTMVLGASTRF